MDRYTETDIKIMRERESKRDRQKDKKRKTHIQRDS